MTTSVVRSDRLQRMARAGNLLFREPRRRPWWSRLYRLFRRRR
jgi:hypothetical protein